jgi:hypothetical protein
MLDYHVNKLSMVIMVDGLTTARLEVQDLKTRPEGSEIQDFKVTMRVNRGDQIFGKHIRLLDGFPTKALNSVALVKAALNLFTADSLVAEDDDNNTDPDTNPGKSDLERGFGRTLRALPTEEESRLRNHGSAVRSGQSVEHGGDGGR